MSTGTDSYAPNFADNLSAQLPNMRSDLLKKSIALLQDDIQDLVLNDPSTDGFHPDNFMLRANEIGEVLLRSGDYSLAQQLYGELLRITLDYRRETGEHRHAGALYANLATAMWKQGNIDQMTINLLNAAKEDKDTYGSEHKDSPAINQLLEGYLIAPALNEAWEAVTLIDPSVTFSYIEKAFKDMGDYGYTFQAYVHTATLHQEENRKTPNIFSKLQIFSALRSLSSLLEVWLKTLARSKNPGFKANSTLFPTLGHLYGGKTPKRWWKAFDDKRIAIGATMTKPAPVDSQLSGAFAIDPKGDDERFWKSLLVAYIVRNYTTHQLEADCDLIQKHADEALGHLLYVMVTAPSRA